MTEQEKNDNFERLAGGIDKAFRLMNIYKDVVGTTWPTMPRDMVDKAKSKEAKFWLRAKEAGYSDAAIDAYLAL